jgi:hypothetical protein
MRLVIVAALMVLSASPASGQRKPARELGTFPVVINTVSTGVVSVTWQPVTKAVAYEVERCEGASLTTCAVKTVPRITAGQPLELRDNLSAGGTYLYRVTAYGSNQLPMAQGQVAYYYTPPPTVVLVPPPTGTVMVTPAGPAQSTAVSPVPAQIHLSWSSVTNAIGFRILRSNSGGEVDRQLPQTGFDAYGNLLLQIIDAPVDFRWTYSYKVYARFQSGTTETLSASSPVASAKSLPFVQVSGLTYTLVPSIQSPGKVDVTLRWNAVSDVEKYIVWDKTYGQLLGSPTAAVYVERSAPTKWSFTVCVGAQYPYNVRQYNTEPCIDIKT